MSEPPASTSEALLFVAAKSLQSYVLGSDKLREMVGATQLIEDFCSEDFATAMLNGLDIPNGEVVTAAAGQTVVRLRSLADARRAAALWPWAAHQVAPGLEVHAAAVALPPTPGGYAQAVELAQSQLAQSRNAVHLRQMPPAPPPALRARRSGRVAEYWDVSHSEREEVDSVAWAKRQRRDAIQNAQRLQLRENPVFQAFAFDPKTTGSDFQQLASLPICLSRFTDADAKPHKFHARQPALALLHADGNGLGQTFMDLSEALKDASPNDATACYRSFSQAFRQVGLDASRQAVDKLHEDFLAPLPLLPIVLAGDDLTLLLRAEIAVPFAEAWLLAFEALSQQVLVDLKVRFPAARAIRADRLTAGAGIAFFQKSHPFIDAYDHCSTLAELAKRKAKEQAKDGLPPSTLAFHRIEISGDNDALEEIPMRPAPHDKRRSGMPYVVSSQSGNLRSLTALRELRDALRALPSGSARQLLSEMRHAPDSANAWLARCLRLLEQKPGGREARARLESALKELHGAGEQQAPLWCPRESDTGCAWSAVPDALAWANLEPAFPNLSSHS